MLTFAFSILALPSANAHTPPWIVKTYAYLAVNPDPIGIGQEAFVSFGIDKVPQTVSAQYGDRWTNFTITVTKPNGDTQTLTGFTADDTGFAHTTYTPDQLGNYTFVLTFGGQTLVGANPPPGGFNSGAAANIGDYYEPSTSSPTVLVVQEEPATQLPFGPLPTNYWQRPINMMNSNWNTISGNWLGTYAYVNAGLGYNATSNFDPYTTAPSTAHILWTTPLAYGGLIGGEYGDTAHSNFYSTAQYECKFLSVVINGVLYYTYTPVSSTNKMGTIAQDIRTGQILWHSYDMNGTLYFGQVYNYISPNQYGGLAYLWTRASNNAWSMYDASTGNWILDITGAVTNGMLVSQQETGSYADGSILEYYINNTDHTLNLWNSSRAILVGASGRGDPDGWSWRPAQGAQIPFEYGIEWTVPLATEISGNPISLSFSGGQSNGNIGISGDAIILGQLGSSNSWENWQIEAAYSLIDGHQFFLTNRTVTAWSRVVTYSIDYGRYVEMVAEDQTIIAFSAYTGEKLWTASMPTNTLWGYLAVYRPISAYGLIYSSTFDGHCYAWNATTGVLAWDWYAGDAGYNTVYDSWPVKTIELVADGKVFLNGGHTYNPPLFRGSHAYCLNATTGDEIWNILSFCESNSPVVCAADGEVMMPNAYDNLLYCYGQGRSATTVEAPTIAVTLGSSLVIRGTVTDQSPGQTCLGIPAAGTPAISDQSMTAWMEYLYEQQPLPTNATGVEVSIDVIDSNNNYRNIGTATSDASGMFTYTWTPDITGDFTVIATFAGSGAYFGSCAETSFTVTKSAQTSQPTINLPPDNTATYITYAAIAIIVAIIIGFAATVLLLRKR